MKLIDLTGQTFSRLTVISATRNNSGECAWNCACSCGNTTVVLTGHLNSGNIKSCGCLRKEVITQRNTKHRLYGSTEYRVWVRMKARCNNPNNIAYFYYGERGIKVCSRWADSPKAFIKDMGKRPTPKHSIDRIDNNGNYTPSNCRWATPKEQGNNRRSNRLLTYCGITLNVSQWAEYLHVPRSTLYQRIYKGWTIENILKKPIRKKSR